MVAQRSTHRHHRPSPHTQRRVQNQANRTSPRRRQQIDQPRESSTYVTSSVYLSSLNRTRSVPAFSHSLYLKLLPKYKLVTTPHKLTPSSPLPRGGDNKTDTSPPAAAPSEHSNCSASAARRDFHGK